MRRDPKNEDEHKYEDDSNIGVGTQKKGKHID